MRTAGRDYGIPVHGEVSSADASAGVSFVFYNADGGVVTIAANQRFVMRSAMSVAVVAGVQVIATITDVAGKRLRRGSFGANSGFALGDIEVWAPKGIVPKYFAPAGQSDCQIEGFLVAS